MAPQDRTPGASTRGGKLDRVRVGALPVAGSAWLSVGALWGVCGGSVELAGLKTFSPLGRRKGAEPRAREAREPGIPPARPLSRSGSCQRLGRSPGGAAPLSWQNSVETWRQVTEREARWGLGKQPQAAGDPRPLTTILAPPVEPPTPGEIRPVTRAGTWPLWPSESHEP